MPKKHTAFPNRAMNENATARGGILGAGSAWQPIKLFRASIGEHGFPNAGGGVGAGGILRSPR